VIVGRDGDLGRDGILRMDSVLRMDGILSGYGILRVVMRRMYGRMGYDGRAAPRATIEFSEFEMKQ
jgi:hypothetical protein